MSDRAVGACIGVVAMVLVSALGLSACTSRASGSNRAGQTPESSLMLPTPLATSIKTPEGTWATVPMGILREPENTFWQLFFRPTGSDTWQNQVAATATATNGGLVLAAGADGQVAVGVRPSQQLHFTPIISSDDGGKTWNNGLLDGALWSSPSALALSAGGEALAIESGGGTGATVLVSTGGFTSWGRLLTLRALGSTREGRACSPTSFTAVAYVGGAPLVGVRCAHPDTGALFILKDGRWRAVGPTKAPPAERSGAEVMGFVSSTSSTEALVGYPALKSSTVVASWTRAGNTWETSAQLVISAGDRVLSYGGIGGSGLFVLLGTPDGGKQLETVNAPGAGWSRLSPPPSSTKTVTGDSGGTTTVLAASATVLTSWTLDTSNDWLMDQRIPVVIHFGSSS